MITIIRLTFLEMLKKKVIYLTLAMTALFLLLYGIGLYFIYDHAAAAGNTGNAIQKMIAYQQLLSMGLYASAFIIAFLSVFSSIGSISTNIEDGTFSTILSKPLPRYKLLLGRFIGVWLTLLFYLTILFLSTIGLHALLGQGNNPVLLPLSIIKSLLCFYLLPTLLICIGIFFSTFMPTLAAGVTLVILYFCGMIGGILEQMGAFINIPDVKIILTHIGVLTSLIIPSDVIYRKTTALLFTGESGLIMSAEGMINGTSQPSTAMMIYILMYSFIFLLFAIKKFNNRDI